MTKIHNKIKITETITARRNMKNNFYIATRSIALIVILISNILAESSLVKIARE